MDGGRCVDDEGVRRRRVLAADGVILAPCEVGSVRLPGGGPERSRGSIMPKLFTRRRVLTASGGVALSPLVVDGGRAAAAQPSGSLITLLAPVRVYDSRADAVPLGGAKLSTGGSVIVTVAVPDEDRLLLAAFVNVTITQTEGAGFLVVAGADPSGERPFPQASNINWAQSGQTIANVALTSVGSESGVEIFARGAGKTHLIVDVQGYVPFVG